MDIGGQDFTGTLACALDSLDETSRLVLALLYVEGLSVEETAQALGLDSSQVDRAATSARTRPAARVQDAGNRAA